MSSQGQQHLESNEMLNQHYIAQDSQLADSISTPQRVFKMENFAAANSPK